MRHRSAGPVREPDGLAAVVLAAGRSRRFGSKLLLADARVVVADDDGTAAWPLATRLEGDTGLAALLTSDAIPVTIIDVPGINPDIDTPADLQSLDRLDQ